MYQLQESMMWRVDVQESPLPDSHADASDRIERVVVKLINGCVGRPREEPEDVPESIIVHCFAKTGALISWASPEAKWEYIERVARYVESDRLQIAISNFLQRAVKP